MCCTQRMMLARMLSRVKAAGEKSEPAYHPMLTGPRLATDDEPMNQRFRKPCRAHPFLYRGNVIGNAPKFDGLVFDIGDGEARAGVAVAGLADGAGIQQIAAGLFDAQGGERFRGTRSNLQHLKIGVLIRESALMMGMSEKSHFGGGIE